MSEILNTSPEILNHKENLDSSVKDEESTMTISATELFLDEILKKKKELHDPRHRRNKFFPYIRDRLREIGLCFSVKTLERKFHNLKKTFDTLCQSKDRCDAGSRKLINWPHFDKMMVIFAEELEIEDAPTMASLYPDLPLPRTALAMHPNKKVKQQLSESDLSSDEDSNGESEQEVSKETVCSKKVSKEIVWSNTAVVDFLNECILKKEDFWDPHVRRRKIFEDIQDRMMAKGYNFSPQYLDQKLRNMRVRYLVIVNAIQENSSGKKNRFRWPYFALMHQIYDGYYDQDKRRKKAGQIAEPKNGYDKCKFLRKNAEPTPVSAYDEEPTSSSMKFRQKRPKKAFQYLNQPAPDVSQLSFQDDFKEPIPAATSESITSNKCPLSPGDFDICYLDNNESTTEEPIDAKPYISQTPQDDYTNDFEFAQKMLALEERRTIATEQLLEELTESNRIREERLKFNRMKLAYFKDRSQRKQLFPS